MVKAGIMTVLGWQLWTGAVFGYEAMYPRTEAGEVELKEVPARKALLAESRGDYFDGDNGLFMKLFRYIEEHDVAMTVPVESDVGETRMRFLVGKEAASRDLENSREVSVVTLPAQRVASAGLRGAYTRDTYRRGISMIETWLREHPEWERGGSPYAVYWHGPFVPWFLKRSEVHLPVVPRAGSAGDAP